ncbi:hypothetical protein A6A05_02925 [Magnetospirillum moscoviense]|uniref:Phage tail collar domain-containing protein n=1 Tax=Magnetospirillum moscoviense TaxID=1437059 RepID=A0A178MM09_9PROT|nr:hypothetical protein A6A05_02925 [Magnetospirillum moscoviense]
MFGSAAATAVLTAVLLSVSSSPANACPSEPYIGTVCTIGTSYCPQDYLPADGRSLLISNNAALYSLLYTVFGGDGKTTFNLPDMRDRVAVGLNSSGSNRGFKLGAEAVTLTTANLTSHTHTATFTPGVNGAIQATATMQVAGVAANSASGGTNAPTPTSNIMAGNAAPTKMWAPEPQTALVSVGGLTAAQSGTIVGQVINDVAGGSKPVPTISPQQGLTYCIAVSGVYPPRP